MLPALSYPCPTLVGNKEGTAMRKLRSFVVVGALAVGMTSAMPAPANAIVCIDNSVYCCGTFYVNGKEIQVIPINC